MTQYNDQKKKDKWVSAARKLLREAGKGMKLQRLCKKVIEARGKKVSGDRLQEVERRLRNSACLAVSPHGLVVLSAALG